MSKKEFMKSIIGTFFIGSALVLTSCGNNAETEVEEVETVEYKLNTEASVINWHGEENAEHGHDGTLSFSEGTVTTEGENIKSGSFTIDMNSVTATTEGYPEEKLGYLTGHLKDTSIFFVAQYPTVSVNIDGYENGKISTTTTVLGVELKNELPVTIEQSEDELHITGDFTMDFTEAKIPYAQGVNEETGEPVLNPNFNFRIDLHLTK